LVAIIAAQQGARDGNRSDAELLAKAKENAALADCRDIEWLKARRSAVPRRQLRHRPQPIRACSVRSPRRPLANAAGAETGPHRVRRMDSRCVARVARAHVPLSAALAGRRAASPFSGACRRRSVWGVPIRFRTGRLHLPALSTAHARRLFEETFGPTVLLVSALSNDPARLAQWRREHDAAAAEFFADGRLRFDYLLTRAIKL
jgi:hypothetical protein